MTEPNPSTPKPSALWTSLRKGLVKLATFVCVIAFLILDQAKQIYLGLLPVVPLTPESPHASFPLFSPHSFFLSLSGNGKNLVFDWSLGFVFFLGFLFYKKARHPRSSRRIMLLMWVSPVVVLAMAHLARIRFTPGWGLLSFSVIPILGLIWLGTRPPFVPEDAKAEEKKVA